MMPGTRNTYVWVATGKVLPDNSPLWKPFNPEHIRHNFVILHYPDADLYDALGHYNTHFVCEALATAMPVPCPFDGFNMISGVCYCVDIRNTNRKNWTDAEAACQKFGSHVHLATIDTQQVGTFMLYPR